MLKYAHIDVKDSDTRPAGPVLDSIHIKWLYDENGDASYLDRTAADHYGKDGANWSHVSEEEKARVVAKHGSIMLACMDYARQDRERLRAFNRGDWHMEGCIAFATVSTGAGPGSRRLQEFQSGGLWGIESDNTPEHRRAFEAGQVADLVDHLEAFGVDCSNIWELAGIPEDHARL